jgi:predicted nucleotidyltransferase
VDLALDRHTLGEVGYKTIQQLLLSRGYHQGEQPFIYFRTVMVGSTTYEVEVDFLAGEYAGSGRRHRTQNVQDMQPRKARGCDLAFTGAAEITLSGILPEGGKDSVRIRVASIAPFLVMKAMALATRLMEKDAWDIYYCIRNYPGGIEKLADEFHPLLKNKLVQEALENIAEKFASPEHVGPKHVADFEEIIDAEERTLLQRDAYERINALLSLLR